MLHSSPSRLVALVPSDHFYRHLDRTLDWSFVRELVQDPYAPLGRPSIDPVGFCKENYGIDEGPPDRGRGLLDQGRTNDRSTTRSSRREK